MAGEEQKVALFADNILLYVGQPAHTIPVLMSGLEECGLYSGFKFNIHKTQILTFNYSPDQIIRGRYCINPETEKMKFLGVVIPREMSKLFSLNYDPLISKIKQDFSQSQMGLITFPKHGLSN